jgi:hypothetical protein
MAVQLRSRRNVLGIAAAATSLVVLTGGPASASAHTISLSGPTSNTLNTPFTYTITGHAGGPADYVVAYEQFHKHAGCASTYLVESTRVFQKKYSASLFKNHKVSGHYSLKVHFGAANPGRHGLCGYLINLNSGKTYAHAGAWWVNHS